MPYVMEDRSPEFVSVSGLTFGAIDYPREVSEAVKKLQTIIGAGVDGQYGGGTHAKFIAWAKTKIPGLPDVVYTLAMLTVPLTSTGKMSAIDIAHATAAYGCYVNPSKCPYPSTAPRVPSPGVPATTLEPYGYPVEMEESWFDKYWWAVALAAVSVGGVVFWQMRKRPAA